MATQLDFTTEYLYPDKPEGLTLPAFLSYGGKTLIVEAKVDTGATCCLFRREHGEELGLPIEQGLHTVLDTLAGPPGSVWARDHVANLRAGLSERCLLCQTSWLAAQFARTARVVA